MNRIDKTFQELKKRKKKAFIAFLTAGDPSLKTTGELVKAFDKVGVDIVELGVPFSDPLADGPTIQASSQRALKKGVTLHNIFQLVSGLRRKTDIPIVLMTYYNPVFHYGETKFVADAKRCGVDGLIIPDLPPEEAKGLIKAAKAQKLTTTFFIAPTTRPQRMKRIAKASTGFVYYVSFAGVTGAAKTFSHNNKRQIQAAKKQTKTPVCVGFGVSTPGQVKATVRIADGVIVGSAIVKEVARHAGKVGLVKDVARFVGTLAAASKK